YAAGRLVDRQYRSGRFLGSRVDGLRADLELLRGELERVDVRLLDLLDRLVGRPDRADRLAVVDQVALVEGEPAVVVPPGGLRVATMEVEQLGHQVVARGAELRLHSLALGRVLLPLLARLVFRRRLGPRNIRAQ